MHSPLLPKGCKDRIYLSDYDIVQMTEIIAISACAIGGYDQLSSPFQVAVVFPQCGPGFFQSVLVNSSTMQGPRGFHRR